MIQQKCKTDNNFIYVITVTLPVCTVNSTMANLFTQYNLNCDDKYFVGLVMVIAQVHVSLNTLHKSLFHTLL